MTLWLLDDGPFDVLSRGFYLYQHLRSDDGASTKDLGEHASIALAFAELNDSVFVTMDKGAAFLALAELGRARVSTPFDCWADLRDRDLISTDDFEELCAEVSMRAGHLVGLPKRFK